jgi:hypothetical protein
MKVKNISFCILGYLLNSVQSLAVFILKKLKLSFEFGNEKTQKQTKKKNIFFILKNNSPFGENSSPPKKKKNTVTCLIFLCFFLEIFLCGIIHGQFKERFSINWQQYFPKNYPNNNF